MELASRSLHRRLQSRSVRRLGPPSAQLNQRGIGCKSHRKRVTALTINPDASVLPVEGIDYPRFDDFLYQIHGICATSLVTVAVDAFGILSSHLIVAG